MVWLRIFDTSFILFSRSWSALYDCATHCCNLLTVSIGKKVSFILLCHIRTCIVYVFRGFSVKLQKAKLQQFLCVRSRRHEYRHS